MQGTEPAQHSPAARPSCSRTVSRSPTEHPGAGMAFRSQSLREWAAASSRFKHRITPVHENERLQTFYYLLCAAPCRLASVSTVEQAGMAFRSQMLRVPADPDKVRDSSSSIQ